MVGIFSVLKNISILADDTAMATKHTASILSDDIAVSAEQSSGFGAKRELPSLWAIAKGSFMNKLIVLPILFILYSFANFLLSPILVIGGIYLSYEAVEKIIETLSHKTNSEDKQITQLSDAQILEKEKKNVAAAIKTDFVLSIEIVLITMDFVSKKATPLFESVVIVSTVAFASIVMVYGTVGLIIRLDDIGLWLIRKKQEVIGKLLVRSMGVLIKALTWIGVIAMLIVAGSIFSHNLVRFEINSLVEVSPLLSTLFSIMYEIIFSFVVGGFFLLLRKIYEKAYRNGNSVNKSKRSNK